MSPAGFLRLAVQTVLAPRDVARLLLSTRLSHEAILTAFALVVVLNALVVGVMQKMGFAAEALPVLVGPGLLALLLTVLLAIAIVAMTWAGRAIGGSGRLEDVALLFIWVQALRALLQVAVALLAYLSGALASVLAVAAMVVGVWILVNFIDVAHGLDSPFKALGVLILGAVGMVIALSLLFPLLGVTPNGISQNV